MAKASPHQGAPSTAGASSGTSVGHIGAVAVQLPWPDPFHLHRLVWDNDLAGLDAAIRLLHKTPLVVVAGDARQLLGLEEQLEEDSSEDGHVHLQQDSNNDENNDNNSSSNNPEAPDQFHDAASLGDGNEDDIRAPQVDGVDANNNANNNNNSSSSATSGVSKQPEKHQKKLSLALADAMEDNAAFMTPSSLSAAGSRSSLQFGTSSLSSPSSSSSSSSSAAAAAAKPSLPASQLSPSASQAALKAAFGTSKGTSTSPLLLDAQLVATKLFAAADAERVATLATLEESATSSDPDAAAEPSSSSPSSPSSSAAIVESFLATSSSSQDPRSEGIAADNVAESKDAHKEQKNAAIASTDNNTRNSSGANAREIRLDTRDPRGNTALTLACALGRKKMVKRLIQEGANARLKSKSGWTPLNEAVSFGSRSMVRCIMEAAAKEIKSVFSARNKRVLAQLQTLDDFSLEIHWQFKSSIPFLSKFCPSDIHRVYKKGSQIRMDSTLVDIDAYLQMVRGNMSHVYTDQGILYQVDHDNKTYEIIQFEAEIHDEDINQEMKSVISRGQLISHDAQLTRAKSGFWGFRSNRTETVNGYRTDVWHLSNYHAAFQSRNEHVLLRKELNLDERAPHLKNESNRNNNSNNHGGDHVENQESDDDSDTKRENDKSQIDPAISPTDNKGQSKQAVDLTGVAQEEVIIEEGDEVDDEADDDEQEDDDENGGRVVEGSKHSQGNAAKNKRGKSNKNKGINKNNTNPSERINVKQKKHSPQNLQLPTKEDHDVFMKEQDELKKFASSLPPPPPPSITKDDYFDPNLRPGEFIHVGRPLHLRTIKRNLNATVWVCENFPMPLSKLIPLVEVLAPTSKHFKRVKEFVEMKLPPGFPLKIEMPVIPTVKVVVTFNNFRELGKANFEPDAFFQIPSGYKQSVTPR